MGRGRAWLVVAAVAVAALVAISLLLDDGLDTTGDDPADPDLVTHEQALRLEGASDATPAPVTHGTDDLVIGGSVFDEHGTALAGVRVGAERIGGWDGDANDVRSWIRATRRIRQGRPEGDRIQDPLAGRFAAQHEATTDAEGRYRLQTDKPGRYRIRALVAPERCSTEATCTRPTDARRASIDLVVLEGSALLGRVVDGTGRGVAAVLEGEARHRTSGPSTADPVATALPDGTFTFPALAPGAWTFSLVVPGRLLLPGLHVKVPHDGPWTIRLEHRTGSVSGTVVDGVGTPIARAVILLETGEEHGHRRAVATTSTADDGTWRLEGVPEGPVRRVTVEADGFGPYEATPPLATWSGTQVKAGAETTIHVRLLAGVRIEGTVRERGTGRPLAGVEVVLLGRSAGERSTLPVVAVSGPSGRYVATGVAPGRWVITARSATHYLPALERPASRGIQITADGVPITVGPPAELLLVVTDRDRHIERDIELAVGLEVRGRVLGPEGAPVAGAEVYALGSSGLSSLAWHWGMRWPGGETALATAGAEGRFRIRNLSPQEDLVLEARKEPYVGRQGPALCLAAGEPAAEVTLVLEAGGVLEGRVLDPEGRGVRASLHRFHGVGSVVSALSSADGAFRLEGVTPGSGDLSASHADYATQSIPVDDLQSGETRSGLEVRFVQGVRVAGQLVDAEGRPVPGRRLAFRPQGGSGNFTVTTDFEGRFTFDHAPEGTLGVRLFMGPAGRPGSSTDIGRVVAPTDDARLVLPSKVETVVEGEVRTPEGTLVPLCRVHLRSIAGRGRRGRPPVRAQISDRDEVVGGRFRRLVEGVAPFEVKVTSPRDASGRALGLREAIEEVAEVAAGPVVVVLEGGVEIVGRVVDPAGVGVAYATVSTPQQFASTDAEGRFRLAGLEEGPTTLQVAPPPGYVKPGPVEATPGGEEVVIQVAPATVVAGDVTDAAGDPAGGFVRITARWPATEHGPAEMRHESLREGTRFRIEGVPEGVEVTLEVSHYGMGSASAAPHVVTVPAGTTDVAIRLGAGAGLRGRVFGPDGQPFSTGYLSLRKSDGTSSSFQSMHRIGEDGRFDISGLEPGEYILFVVAMDEPWPQEVHRVTAPAGDLSIRLAEPRSIAGRILGEGDVSRFEVRAFAEGERVQNVGSTAHSEADGSFEIRGLGSGRFILRASTRDGNRYAISAPVPAGTNDVRLRLVQGEPIGGTVEDAQGQPVARAMVRATGETWSVFAFSDDEGRFVLSGLPAGSYALRVRSTGTEKAIPDLVRTGDTDLQITFE